MVPRRLGKLSVTDIELWRNHDVLGGVWWWAWETKVVPIKDCQRATLKGGVWIVGPVSCAVEVNGYRVWEAFEPIQGWRTIDMDVTYVIREYSDNSFSIGVGPMGAATWTLTLSVEWTSQPPSPPKKPLEEYLKWVFIIGGIGVGGVVVAKIIEAMKKK
jgi:hypothetical protein